MRAQESPVLAAAARPASGRNSSRILHPLFTFPIAVLAIARRPARRPDWRRLRILAPGDCPIMNGSDIEQSSTVVDLEEPPGSSFTSSSSYNLPILSPPVSHRRDDAPAPERPAALTPRKSRANTRTRAFRRAFYRDVPDKDWN